MQNFVLMQNLWFETSTRLDEVIKNSLTLWFAWKITEFVKMIDRVAYLYGAVRWYWLEHAKDFSNIGCLTEGVIFKEEGRVYKEMCILKVVTVMGFEWWFDDAAD